MADEGRSSTKADSRRRRNVAGKLRRVRQYSRIARPVIGRKVYSSSRPRHLGPRSVGPDVPCGTIVGNQTGPRVARIAWEQEMREKTLGRWMVRLAVTVGAGSLAL